MQAETTFVVTMVRAGTGLPSFEVGAYRYTGARLPAVGDIITITSASSAGADRPRELLGYVTRVDPASETPIRVTEPTGTLTSADDYIVAA